MNRRTFLSTAAVATAVRLPDAFGATFAPDQPAPRALGQPPRAKDPTDPRALIMDAMGELRTVYDSALVREMLGSGMDSITITLCDPKPVGAEALELAVDSLLEYDRYLRENPDLFVRANSLAQVDEARRSGRLAVFYLYQNSVQFGSDLDRVDFFRGLGVTSSQITYNEVNRAGVGCMVDGNSTGLTEFGYALVERMNSAGMLIDLSHAGAATMTDTIEHSRLPVIISHTACDAVHAHRRNTSDPILRSLADRGGVVGVCQLRPFLTDKKEDNLHTYFDHIDHAVQTCGVEHVSIGSDRDHRRVEMTPEYLAELRSEEGNVENSALPFFIDELNGPRRMEVVWDGLVARGYASGDIERIMGLNLYRLYGDVIG